MNANRLHGAVPALGVLEANGVHLAGEPKRQVLLLDDELVAMEKKITTLKAENLKLKADNEPLQRDVDRYKKQLEIKNGLSLHKDEESIMKLLCKEQKAMFNHEFAKALNMNIVRVRAMLTTLESRGLMRYTGHFSGGIVYSLSDDGAAYAVDQGWV